MTLQSGQRSVGFSFSSKVKKSGASGSVLRVPASLIEARIKGMTAFRPIRKEDIAKYHTGIAIT